MSYSGSGRFPTERASKIGHMRFVEDPYLRSLVAQFVDTAQPTGTVRGARTGTVDMTRPHGIRYVVAVDGGQAVVPNALVRKKTAAYLSICALLLDLEYVRSLRRAPVVDPRDLARALDGSVRHDAAMVPLSGWTMLGESVRDTIRTVVHRTLVSHDLYPTLRHLLLRPYDPAYRLGAGEAPHFYCTDSACRAVIHVPADAPTEFPCLSCGRGHYLADWLGVNEAAPEDWAREEVASTLRNVLEALRLFSYIQRIERQQPALFSEFLFVKDGPLGLWSKTAGLVEPIRAYLAHLRDSGCRLHLVGVEKNGDLASHAEEIKGDLPNPGDFFLPSLRVLIEEIAGFVYDPSLRNRVNYGAKTLVRLGKDHILALNVPTGDFLADPTPADLIGFEESVRALAETLSYRYENAIVPLVLANEFASISERPSGDILARLLDRSGRGPVAAAGQ